MAYQIKYPDYDDNPKPEKELKIVNDWMYHNIPVPSWFGIGILKNPLDLWVFQEIIFECRPDFIIEVGFHWGGSTLFFAHICTVMQHGEILSIDCTFDNLDPRAVHKRIHRIKGWSWEQKVLDEVQERIKYSGDPNRPSVMVILDADHNKESVLKELNLYGHLVTKGQYLIVEDTNLNGHPSNPGWGEGPYEAVHEFYQTDLGKKYFIDRSQEKFFITLNPCGFLRKISE